MIAEAIDTAFTVGAGLFAWIFVGAFVATFVALSVCAAVSWAVKQAWRAFGPHARRGSCTPAGAPHGPSCDSRDANTPQRAAQRHTAPSWAHTEHDHQEAA